MPVGVKHSSWWVFVKCGRVCPKAISTRHQVCLIIRQLLFLRLNGPERKKRSQDFKMPRCWSQTIQRSGTDSRQGHKNERKRQKGFEKNQMWSCQEHIILQCCHIPELQPLWSLQKSEVFSAQRHGEDKQDVKRWRLGQEIPADRFLVAFLDWDEWF